MGENTAIEWAKHTHNPWVGCTKVSPGCDHCYAERFAHRFGGGWGPGAPRRLTSESNWKLPLRWNRAAEKAGRRDRVFCASLADVFDAEVPDEWRDRLFALTALTRNLDWLLLTKRPMVALRYLGRRALPSWPLPNVWLGTSVENQAMADLRIPTLLEVPAAKHFLSVEPLLGPIDLRMIDMKRRGWLNSLDGVTCLDGSVVKSPRLDQVITGGESGPKARPMHPAWARSIRDQCVEAGVPYFHKQNGEWTQWAPGMSGEVRHISARDGRLFTEPAGMGDREHGPRADTVPICRVGKKAAGRLLDGRTWDEVPGGKA